MNLVKTEINDSKTSKDDFSYDEKFNQFVVMQDVYKVQDFISRTIQNQKKSNTFNNMYIDDKDEFPDLGCDGEWEKPRTRDLIYEANKAKHKKKRKNLNKPITDYFHQKPTLQVNDNKDSSWKYYYEDINMITSVS